MTMPFSVTLYLLAILFLCCLYILYSSSHKTVTRE